jgi:hypothetical protein
MNPSAQADSAAPAQWRSRFHSSVKRGLVSILAAGVASIALAGLSRVFGQSRLAPLFLFVPPAMILAGFVWGAVSPRRYDGEPSGPYTGCLVGMLIPSFLFCGLVWVFASFFFMASGDSIDHSADVYDPAESWAGRWIVEQFVPAGATNFRCTGDSGWGGGVAFSCEVDESNFLAHAAANDIELRRDDPTFNANPDTNERPGYRGVDRSSLLHLPEGGVPERFWFYGWTFPNHGGWAVLYDIDRGVLYGHYSAN